ncbi:MAG: DUF455 domain-containing protein [Gammaproteobacteria bacterium HGW-Gammaproteobacteria-8]|nr:MAG: DUF455 domain-containing protein [Gammaproteobacteria bacterium HGW-Gammaproteobacteria-8]
MSEAGLWAEVASALAETDPEPKCCGVDRVEQGLAQAGIDPVPLGPPELAPPKAGRPEQPRLVRPAELARRGLGTVAGRIALLHAVAHIEFNAINLALDAALRFAQMPAQFHRDWLSVAVDETRHFRMLRQRLVELGADYGDLPAHNGLWDMAEKTAHDVLLRMALVPRVLEARGLDVTPGMIERLRHAGDEASAACLEIILAEEVRHVEIGSHWYRWLCAERGIEPESTFRRLLGEYFTGPLRGPFNIEARLQAGFSERELDLIETANERK